MIGNTAGWPARGRIATAKTRYWYRGIRLAGWQGWQVDMPVSREQQKARKKDRDGESDQGACRLDGIAGKETW